MKALRAIRKALKKTPADQLLAATQAYARQCALRPASDGCFIPYPASWFNGARFEETLEIVPEEGQRKWDRDAVPKKNHAATLSELRGALEGAA